MKQPAEPTEGTEEGEHQAESGAAMPALDASMFDVQGGVPESSGTVTASIDRENNEVRLQAPSTTFNATVTYKPDPNQPSFDLISVGFVQTLLQAERVGIYKKPGGVQGEEVARNVTTLGAHRDARWQEGEGGTKVAIVGEPWYDNPESVSSANPMATINSADRPEFVLPLSVGEGVLTETEGQDQFNLSVAAKCGDDIVYLTSFDWEVRWALSIVDQSFAVGGQAVGGTASTEAAEPVPPPEGGQLPVETQEAYMAFSSVEAATYAHASVLMESLMPAKSHDLEAWTNIVEALRQKDPSFVIAIKAIMIPERRAWNELMVRIVGDNQVEKGPIVLQSGEARSVTFRLTEVFPDPQSITSNSTLKIQVYPRSGPTPASAPQTWHYPFARPMAGVPLAMEDGGTYSMSCSLP